MTFTQKELMFKFTLASGNFQASGSSGGNSLTLSNLRAEVRILKAGGVGLGSMQAAIYGMTLSHMNQLTQRQSVTTTTKNTVVVRAGDIGGSLTEVFQGTIYHAWMDTQAMPDVAFRVEAQAGLYEAQKPIEPTSVSGTADVAKTMQQITKAIGLQFEDNNVRVKIANPYLPGTGVTQIKTLAKMAGIEHIIDLGKLAIWNPGQARSGSTLISPDTGMVGYPCMTYSGVEVKTLFQPTIKYGAKIQIRSSVTPASGEFIIYALDYDLASQMPNGPWFCLISAYDATIGPPPVA